MATDDSGGLLAARSLELVFPGPLRAIAGLTLDVPRGQFVSIVGPSGCGKSTLLRLIAGLLAPTSGVITLAGKTPAAARRKDVRVSFVFQDPTLLPWRNVADNIRLPLELGGEPRDRQRRLVEQGLEMVGLRDFAARFPRQLSGGMRMRASLARALATEPELLLMDEPFGALDDISRQRLNEELLTLWVRQGWTVVFVTHNITEAVFLGERVLVMGPRPGRIVGDILVPFGPSRTPELRAQGEFARLTGEVSGCLRRACA